MRVGIDVDGVLANFFQAYEDLTIAVTGRDLFVKKFPSIPTVWDWPQAYGYTNTEMSMVWAVIKQPEREFWYTLSKLDQSLPKGFLADYCDDNEVYFITDRPGESAKYQTEEWLKDHHNIMTPTVLISRKGKGACVSALDLELYVDDKGENIVEVEKLSPSTHACLINRPYNQHVEVQNRVKNLMEALSVTPDRSED